MVRGRAQGHKRSPVKPEGGEPVADSHFRLRRRGLDRVLKVLECGSLIGAQSGEVFVERLGFGCHGSFCYASFHAWPTHGTSTSASSRRRRLNWAAWCWMW